MKLSEALAIIKGKPNLGFMVHCTKKSASGLLATEYFPDPSFGEELVKTEEEAWILAEEFAAKTKGLYVDIYVVNSHFVPVDEKRTINNK